jgi:hypothetical protein
VSRTIATSAGVVGLLLLGGLLAASHLSREAAPTSAVRTSPAESADSLAYAARLNSDLDALDAQDFKKLDCKTRALCIEELQAIRALTMTVVGDASDQPPTLFAAQAKAITQAGQEFLRQLDATLSVVQKPGSDYVAASATPNVHDLDMAVGAVVCWPKKPVAAYEAGEAATGFACN